MLDKRFSMNFTGFIDVCRRLGIRISFYAPIKWKLQHPPGQPPVESPGIWTFEVWVVQIPIPRVKTGVQMPHLKVILGDQMPLPRTNMAKMSDGTEVYLFSWKNNLYVLWNKKYWSSLIQPIKECTMYFDQIQYFKHQQNDQWETSTSSCENIKSI